MHLRPSPAPREELLGGKTFQNDRSSTTAPPHQNTKIKALLSPWPVHDSVRNQPIRELLGCSPQAAPRASAAAPPPHYGVPFAALRFSSHFVMRPDPSPSVTRKANTPRTPFSQASITGSKPSSVCTWTRTIATPSVTAKAEGCRAHRASAQVQRGPASPVAAERQPGRSATGGRHVPARINESAAGLDEASSHHTAALAAAKKAQADLDADRKALQTVQHALSRARSNQADAAEAMVRARKHVEMEVARVRKAHADEAGQLRLVLSALTSEQNTLVKDEQARRNAVMRQFDERVGRLRAVRDATLQRLTDEAAAADKGVKEQLERAEEAHSRALEGLGVDPAKVQELNARIGRLEAKLLAIAQNAHNMAAWRKFELDLLPLKPEREAREQELRQRAEMAATDKASFKKDMRDQRAKLVADEANTRHQLTTTQEELDNLRRLRDQQLAPYRNQGPVYVGEGLYHDLSSSARTHLDALGTATHRLESATRDLCSKMRERTSAISQWLDGRQSAHNALIQQREDQGLGDAYLQHERSVDWGRAVCEWFAPLTHREYHIALRHEMDGYFAAAESFVNHIANFEAPVDELNRRFNKSLDQASGFKRFNNLHINISSTATSSPALKALREMRDVSQSRISSHRTSLASNPQLPSDEEISLVCSFPQPDPRHRLPAGESGRACAPVLRAYRRRQGPQGRQRPVDGRTLVHGPDGADHHDVPARAPGHRARATLAGGHDLGPGRTGAREPPQHAGVPGQADAAERHRHVRGAEHRPGARLPVRELASLRGGRLHLQGECASRRIS